MAMEESGIKPRYVKGQKVIIKPVTETGLSQRESDINKYAGQVGEVSRYYWVSPRTGQVLYMYTVRLGADNKELVLHEDEIEDILE